MSEIVEDWRKKDSRSLSKLFDKITVTTIFLLGVGFFILLKISENTQDQRYNYLIYGILIVIILYLVYKPTKNKSLIPDHVAKKIAQEALDTKVRDGIEFPFDSKVYVQSACHTRWETGPFDEPRAIALEIGFIEKVHGSQFTRNGVISIHPFEGTIMGISWRPLGYTGLESRDKVNIPVTLVKGTVDTSDMIKDDN